MKSLFTIIAFMLICVEPGLSHYTPPDVGSPGSSGGSGTRLTSTVGRLKTLF